MNQPPSHAKDGAYILVIMLLGGLCVGLAVWGVRSHMALQVLEAELDEYRGKAGKSIPPRRRSALSSLFGPATRRTLPKVLPRPLPVPRKPPGRRLPSSFFSSKVSAHMQLRVSARASPLHAFGRYKPWRKRQRYVTLVQWRNAARWPSVFRDSVKYIFFQKLSMSTADLALLANFPNVRSVQINDATVTGPPIKKTASLLRLYNLSVHRNHGDMKWLCAQVFHHVHYLSVYQSRGLSYPGMKCIGKMSALNRLQLTNVLGVNDRGLKALALLSRLRSLRLRQVSISNAALKIIGSFSYLTSLHLGFIPHLTDAGLRHLAALTSLRRLTLRNIPITGVGFRYLSRATLLRHLTLSQTKLTVAGAQAVGDLRSLRTLYLTNTGMTDKGARALSRLYALRRLRLVEPLLSDAAMIGVAKMRTLRYLYLDSTRIGDRGVAHLRRLRTLRTLSMRGTTVTDRSVRYFLRMTRLFSLNLARTGLSLRGVKRLRGLRALRYLYVSPMLPPALKARWRRANPRLRIYDRQ